MGNDSVNLFGLKHAYHEHWWFVASKEIILELNHERTKREITFQQQQKQQQDV
jgi:hypothetical protein